MNSKKKLFTLLFFTYLFFLSFPIQAKDNYPYSSIGDGKQGVSVALTLVDGITADPDGNVYISHRSQNRIRKLNPNGIITTIAGNGIAGFSGDGGNALDASLNFPAGLVFDRGNL